MLLSDVLQQENSCWRAVPATTAADSCQSGAVGQGTQTNGDSAIAAVEQRRQGADMLLNSLAHAAAADAGSSGLSLPPLQPLQPGQTSNPSPAANLAMIIELREQMQRLCKVVSEQHTAVLEEIQLQRYQIHQIPGMQQCMCNSSCTQQHLECMFCHLVHSTHGMCLPVAVCFKVSIRLSITRLAIAAGRMMNHMVMVMGTPSEEQRRTLEAAADQWNRQQRWNT